MKKRLLIFFICIITAVCRSAYAKPVDSAVVNRAANSVHIEGNVKNGSSEYLHRVYSNDFESDLSQWRSICSDESKERIKQYSEADGNKCLSVSGRTFFSDGVGINIADCLNVNGMGKYIISFRMRAAEDANVRKGTVSMNIVPQASSGTKYTRYISPVTDEWQTFSYTINITSFGYDDEGNPLQTCPKGSLSGNAANGDLYISGWDSRYYTDDDKENFVYDLRDYYIDDFSIQYSEKILSMDSDEPLKCSLTVSDGSKELLSSEFMTNADGSYDYSATIPNNIDYGDVSLNLKCADTKTDETVKPNIKNNIPDISVGYEDDSLRVGIYPYDYIDFNKNANPTLIAALYNSDGLAAVMSKKVSPAGSNEMVKFNFKNTTGGEVVKFFVWNNLNSLVPICDKRIKDTAKGEHMVYLIGDSICFTYDESRWPLQGWGYLLPEYFDDCLTFKDCSGGGLSTKSYITPIFGDSVDNRNTWKDENDPYGTWEKIQQHLNPGDFVIVGLGVNDTAGDNDNPYSKGTSEEVYSNNLKKFAEDTTSRGANIIFTTMTLHAGANGQTNFENENTLKYRQRAEVMMKTADEIGATYVDLGKYQLNYYNELAKMLGGNAAAYDKVREYFHGGVDMLHYNINGANKLAQFVAYLIRNTSSDMSKYVKDFDVTYELEDVSGKYAPTK